MTYVKHANLKYKFGNRHLGLEEYYASTVGLNEDIRFMGVTTVIKYIYKKPPTRIIPTKV